MDFFPSDKTIKILIAIIAFCLPLQIFSFYVGFSILAVRIAFGFAIIIIITRQFLSGKIMVPKTIIDLPLLIVLIVNLLVTFFAFNVILSLKEFILQVLVLAFFYTICFLVHKKSILQFVLYAYLFSALLNSFYGIFQQLGFFFGWDTNLPFIDIFSFHEAAKDPNAGFWAVDEVSSLFVRIRGTFLDTNIFAGFIVSAFGISSVKLIEGMHNKDYKKQIGYGMISIIFLLSIFISMSRSALVGLFLLCIIGMFKLRREILRTNIWFKFVSSFGIAITLLFIIFPELFDLVVSVIASISFDAGGSRGKSTQLHLLIAQKGWEMFTEHPFLGVGLSNFRVFFAQDVWLWHTGITNKAMMAHSIYLSFLAESGLVGSVVNLSLIGLILYTTNRAINSLKDLEDKVLLLGPFLAYIGLLGCNIFYQYYYMEFVWFVIAINIAGAKILLHR